MPGVQEAGAARGVSCIWKATVSIPHLSTEHLFECVGQPKEADILSALKMRARDPGDPDEVGVGYDARLRRLFPTVTVELLPRAKVGGAEVITLPVDKSSES